jgi:hypothetical protein
MSAGRMACRVVVSLPSDLRAALAAEQTATGIPMSEFVRRALVAELARRAAVAGGRRKITKA